MCCPSKIISVIVASALVVFSASVTGALLTNSSNTVSEEDFAYQYRIMPPPKAYAIARSPSGRRWVEVISWAESNVAFARAKATFAV